MAHTKPLVTAAAGLIVVGAVLAYISAQRPDADAHAQYHKRIASIMGPVVGRQQQPWAADAQSAEAS